MVDLGRLDEYRENNRIEAKKATGGFPESVWETYSAFANTLGGIILMGVVEAPDDTLRAVGLPSPEQRVREFWRAVNDKSKVSANILSAGDVAVQDAGGRRIVVINVPRASRMDKPVYIGGSAYGGSYRRSGEGDYKCSDAEVASMLRDASGTTWDMFAAEDFSINSLDLRTLKRYRAEVERNEVCPALTKPRGAEFLKRTGAAAKGADGKIHPTAAGLLAFGKYRDISALFPQYRLELKTPDGRTTVSGKGRWSGNVFDFYLLTKKALGEYSARYEGSSEIFGALCEALVNGLVNADYYGDGGISVELSEGKAVFSNAGSFRINPENAASGGVSDPRSAPLSRIFSYAGGGRRSGSGIPGIFAVWKKRGWKTPSISESFAPDKIVAEFTFAPGEDAPVQPGSAEKAALYEIKKAAVIDYLTDNACASLQTLCDALDLSVKDASFIIDALRAENVLSELRAGNETVYRLKR